MNHPHEVLTTLRLCHTNVESALADEIVTSAGTPACVGEALRLIRDTGGRTIRVAHLARLFRRPIPDDPVEGLVKKFLRYRSCTTYTVTRLLNDIVEQWALPPNLQPVVTGRYGSLTIPGVHFPWYGNPKYLTILGDGLPAITVRVLATDAGGPCRFKLVRRDDPELRADVEGMTDMCASVRAERLGEHQYPDLHYQPLLCDAIRDAGLDGELDLGRFYKVLPLVFRPPSAWHPRPVQDASVLA